MNLMTRQETAEMIGISVQTLDRMIKDNRIPYIKIGRLIRFNKEQVTDWVMDGGEREKPIYT